MVMVHRSWRSLFYKPSLGHTKGSLLLLVGFALFILLLSILMLNIWVMTSPSLLGGPEDDKNSFYSHHLKNSGRQTGPHHGGRDSTGTSTGTGTGTASRIRRDSDRPNILFLITDQQRFDTIRRVQDELWYYENATKIQTPNLDRLSKRGAYFETAYTQCAVCAPARTTLRTGCTVERTGVQMNDLIEAETYGESRLFTQRVEALEGLDKILNRYGGYINEYYGKWHMPERLWGSIQYNAYDYKEEEVSFDAGRQADLYGSFLDHFKELQQIDYGLEPEMQLDTWSGRPYTPIQIDSRFHMSKGTKLNKEKFKPWQRVEPSQAGVSKFSHEYSSAFCVSDLATKALHRLVAQREQQDGINRGRPFALTVSFHGPHPPMIASPKHFQRYDKIKQRKLLVPKSFYDDMRNSQYEQIASQDPNYHNEEMVQEWTAVYYAMIEEIDERIGEILKHLGNQASNTLIIFTSDHGEMLGAHGMRDKFNFYEEASRVPLFISWPGTIPEGTVVKEAVSHLDVFATILDYVGLSEYDGSDGSSLRPMVEGRSYNADYDEDVVVSEWDARMPDEDNPSKLWPRIDEKPALMIRKGNYKLMTHKLAKSHRMDLMFNLKEDPFELNNLLGHKSLIASVATREKAEHLRCLLLDWMQCMDGGTDPNIRYYSDPGANYWEGRGDIEEVRRRQSWPALEFWVSDSIIEFGRLVWDGYEFVRNEYLYLGTRTADETTFGPVEIATISIVGRDAAFFRIDTQEAADTTRGAKQDLSHSINKKSNNNNNKDGEGTSANTTVYLYKNQCVRIKVSLATKSLSMLPSSPLDAFVHIEPPSGGTIPVRDVMLVLITGAAAAAKAY